jgi:gluconokinase
VAQHLVVIGVSGSGKSTVGQLLAARLGRRLIEADNLHSAENIARMASGVPLTDEDRLPWLNTIVDLLREAEEEGSQAVVVCSALRESYRDILRTAGPMYFVHLNPDVETVRMRIQNRVGHFMPASLLESQLDTMERLRPDEHGIELTGTEPAADLVEQILHHLPSDVLDGEDLSRTPGS